MGRALRSIIVLLVTLAIVACGQQKKNKFVFDDKITTVTKKNYLSGKAFCARYRSITTKEHGKFIKVPINYDDPALGTIEVYAWTLRPFDPKLPSFVYINGGPGQNSHGMRNFLTYPKILLNKGYKPEPDKNWNQIHFDQRGLGCSAPDTFEQYQDHNLYSTSNTAQDLELVREAFGITKWSLYGISYGTLPATVYASQFPERITAVVLEGTVGDLAQTHNADYKVEKLNLTLEKLPPEKKAGLAKLWDDPQFGPFVQAWINQLMYFENGFSKIYDFVNKVIISENEFDEKELNRIKKRVEKHHYGHPQHPAGVDFHVYQSLYCKELASDVVQEEVDFNEKDNRFESDAGSMGGLVAQRSCEAIGVTAVERNPYDINNISVQAPIVYFQGSHDGATHAQGALNHWRKVAKGRSQFIMRSRGGHNPLTTMMYLPENLKAITDNDIQSSRVAHGVFQLALQGQLIEMEHIDRLNQYLPSTERWSLLSKSPVGYRQAEEIMKHISAHDQTR